MRSKEAKKQRKSFNAEFTEDAEFAEKRRHFIGDGRYALQYKVLLV
jgi:hypothetical protein